MPPQPVELTVGQLAYRSGVAPSAIRFYEEQGLVFSHRTSGNQRRFHRAMLRRIAFIKASQAAGIPLARIGQMLAALGETDSPTKRLWHRASTEWVDDINERIALLERLRDQVESCVGCGCLSMTACQLLNPDDALGARGPGPQRLLPTPGA